MPESPAACRMLICSQVIKLFGASRITHVVFHHDTTLKTVINTKKNPPIVQPRAAASQASPTRISWTESAQPAGTKFCVRGSFRALEHKQQANGVRTPRTRPPQRIQANPRFSPWGGGPSGGPHLQIPCLQRTAPIPCKLRTEGLFPLQLGPGPWWMRQRPGVVSPPPNRPRESDSPYRQRAQSTATQ